jgi:hypothetical protein
MSSAEMKAALLGHPVAAADASGLTGIYRIALTGSPQTMAVPAGIRGKFATLTVVSNDNAQYAFGTGTTAPALVKDQVSAFDAPSAAAGKTIFSKTSIDRIIPRNATFLSVVATGTTGGYLEIDCSEHLS